MENSVSNGSAFTHNGDFFALVSVDGRLRIWDTISGKLLQEFSANSTVESSCTCLCWTREKRKGKTSKEPIRKKRKKKDNIDTDGFNYPSIVLGTNNGTLLSYEPNDGEGRKSFGTDHTKSINSVAYHNERDKLYTCSKDKYVGEWCFETETLEKKWKADKLSVEMICISPSGKSLLTAGQCIKLWDLDTKELLQKFNGHSSPVSILQFTMFRSSFKKDSDQGYYFISGAREERVINVWNVNFDTPVKSSIASYMLSDVPLLVDSLVIPDAEKPLKLCAACKNGNIHVFENIMNGKTKRPIESSIIINMAQKEGMKSRSLPAKFFNISLYQDSSVKIKVAFGNSVKPNFELLEFSELKSSNKIVRDLSSGLVTAKATETVDKPIEGAKLNKISQVLGSSSFVPIPSKRTVDTKIVIDVNGNEEDRQKTDTNEDIISMEERLSGGRAGDVPKKDYQKLSKSTPNAASFSQMLIQALHSNDENLLCELLFKSHNEPVLKNTLKRVPNHLVLQLLNIIVDKLKVNPSRSKSLIVWLKVIMGVHLVYLMMNPDFVNSLSSLYQFLKAQQEIQPKLLNIQGKVDLLLAHSSSVKSDSSDDDINTPAVVFNDDSDDETEDLFGATMSKVLEKDLFDDDEEDVEMEDEEANKKLEKEVNNSENEVSDDDSEEDNINDTTDDDDESEQF